MTEAQPNDDAGRSFSATFWLVCAATGVATGIGAMLLMAILRFVQHVAWSYDGGPFEAAVAHASFARRIGLLALAGLISTAGTIGIRRLKGDARGLDAALWFASGKMHLVPTFANGTLSIVLVALGVSLGREAAPKEVGAALASGLADRFSLTRAERRVLAACAAGAGIAAVYNVPLGGALFAVEVLLGTLSVAVALPALLVSLIATAVAWLTLPAVPTYAVTPSTFSAAAIVWALLFGPIAGCAAVAFVRGVAWARANRPAGRLAYVVPMLVFTMLGVVACAFPQVLGNGKNVAQDAFGASLGLRLFGTLAIVKAAATVASLETGAPGGLFTPTVSIGALLGGFFGSVWSIGVPSTSIAGCSIVAAGAFLAATTRGPISAIVLILELADHSEALVMPLLVATAGALAVSNALRGRSVYAIAFSAPRFARDAGVARLVLPASASVRTALARFAIVDAQRLFVLDERRRYVGAVTRADLLEPNAGGVPYAVLRLGDVASLSRDDAAFAEMPVVDARGTLVDIVTPPARARGR